MEKPLYMEEWRPIKDFPSYQVSNYGRVYNIVNGFELTKSLAGYRYYSVKLVNEHGRFHKRVCRLVATAFIPNPDNLATVNHIDEDKLNDCVHNLEWMSNVDNIRYSQAKRVVQLDPTTLSVVSIHPSIRAAGEAMGDFEKHKNIYKACLGERSQAYGFFWLFEENFLDTTKEELATRAFNKISKKKAILQLDKDTEQRIAEFESITAAAKALGKRTGGISSCLTGYAATAFGYKWKYKEADI